MAKYRVISCGSQKKISLRGGYEPSREMSSGQLDIIIMVVLVAELAQSLK